jgi:HSP20 family protein
MTSETRSEVVKKGEELHKAAPTHTLTPYEEMERLFERVFPRGWLRPMQWEWPSWSVLPAEGKLPCVDVIERDDELLVRAELPGVDKKDIEVSVSDSGLTIRASTRREEKEEKGEYYRHEIAEGTFVRSVTLPAEVDSEHAKASFKDGMLELHLPKIAKAKRRTISLD